MFPDHREITGTVGARPALFPRDGDLGGCGFARLEGGVPLGADSGFCSPSAGGAGAADRHRAETVTRPRADRPEGAHGHHLSTAHPHLPRGPGERTSFPQSVSAAHACTSLPTCWQNITLNKGREKQRFAKKKMRSFLAFIWLC